MSLMNLPVFAALNDKMRWHQTRQGLLAENIANAETPGYRGRDLKPFSFGEATGSSGMLPVAATQPGHIALSAGSNTRFGARGSNGLEITPDRNGITLEDEMMKVTTNLMDYQAATTLYQRSVRILRTALGKQA